MAVDFNQLLDQAEQAIDDGFSRFDPPTSHHFLPGFYCRRIEMPEGFLCTTKKHGRKHAFYISEGIVHIRTESGETQRVEAPFWGFTEPGTRRIIFCETDVTWTTFHPCEVMNVEKLVNDIEQEIMIPCEHKVPIADALNRQPKKELLYDY